MRSSLSNPWRRDDSAMRPNNELHGTLDPNRKYHQRKPITIRLNEQKYYINCRSRRVTTLQQSCGFCTQTGTSHQPIPSHVSTPSGKFSSMMRTRLPTSRFGFTLNHLGRCCSNGGYYSIHRRRNCATKCWTHLQWRRYTSASPKPPHGSGDLCPSINKWFGVSAVSSFTSSLDFVNGLLFMTFSI